MYKNNNISDSMTLGMSYADAKEMVENEGFMLEYLPKCFQTEELKAIANQWWEDRFLNLYAHYKSHPQEVAEILSQAKVAGSQIVVGSDMKFEVELAEID